MAPAAAPAINPKLPAPRTEVTGEALDMLADALVVGGKGSVLFFQLLDLVLPGDQAGDAFRAAQREKRIAHDQKKRGRISKSRQRRAHA